MHAAGQCGAGVKVVAAQRVDQRISPVSAAASLITTSTTWAHCCGLMSQPVGLWQQACNTTMVPGAAAFSAASIASKRMPRVAAS